MDREGVGCHVVALDTVAARDGAHELAFLESEADGKTVDLRLDHIGQILAVEQFNQARGFFLETIVILILLIELVYLFRGKVA